MIVMGEVFVEKCGCCVCRNARSAEGFFRGMVVCSTCGDKRCPHADDHRLVCTGKVEESWAFVCADATGVIVLDHSELVDVALDGGCDGSDSFTVPPADLHAGARFTMKQVMSAIDAAFAWGNADMPPPEKWKSCIVDGSSAMMALVVAAENLTEALGWERAHVEWAERKMVEAYREVESGLVRERALRTNPDLVKTEVEGVWRWQGEGDHLESLTCPVVMRADTLRALVARAEAAEREADRLRHGVAIEGDYVCPDAQRADALATQVLALRIELDGVVEKNADLSRQLSPMVCGHLPGEMFTGTCTTCSVQDAHDRMAAQIGALRREIDTVYDLYEAVRVAAERYAAEGVSLGSGPVLRAALATLGGPWSLARKSP